MQASIENVEFRRALNTVSLGLFTYLAAVVTALAAVAGTTWSPSPLALGAAVSAAVGLGAWVFPRWAARVAVRMQASRRPVAVPVGVGAGSVIAGVQERRDS